MPKFKLNLTHKNRYSEIQQANPLKWRILYKNEDGSLSSQAGLIKCKDFFNDLVAVRHGKPINIYGFDATKIKYNEEGLWVLLSNVFNCEQFMQNIDKAINPTLQEFGLGKIEVYKHTKTRCLILLPDGLFKATFYMSAVTALIRACNYDIDYEQWEDFFTKDTSPIVSRVEKCFSVEACKHLTTKKLSLPEGTEKYWFYAGKIYNSDYTGYLGASTYHDNGVTSWLAAFTHGY